MLRVPPRAVQGRLARVMLLVGLTAAVSAQSVEAPTVDPDCAGAAASLARNIPSGLSISGKSLYEVYFDENTRERLSVPVVGDEFYFRETIFDDGWVVERFADATMSERSWVVRLNHTDSFDVDVFINAEGPPKGQVNNSSGDRYFEVMPHRDLFYLARSFSTGYVHRTIGTIEIQCDETSDGSGGWIIKSKSFIRNTITKRIVTYAGGRLSKAEGYRSTWGRGRLVGQEILVWREEYPEFDVKYPLVPIRIVKEDFSNAMLDEPQWTIRRTTRVIDHVEIVPDSDSTAYLQRVTGGLLEVPDSTRYNPATRSFDPIISRVARDGIDYRTAVTAPTTPPKWRLAKPYRMSAALAASGLALMALAVWWRRRNARR